MSKLPLQDKCNLTAYEQILIKKPKIKDKIAFQLNCLCPCVGCKWEWYLITLGE